MSKRAKLLPLTLPTKNQLDLVFTLASNDLKLRYRRSSLGPFWITISTGTLIATIGTVFGLAFHMEMTEYLPHLSFGLIFWTFISGGLQECCSAFLSAESLIKQHRAPLQIHVWRVVLRNILILAHNVIILAVVVLVFPQDKFSWTMVIIFLFSVILISLFMYGFGSILAFFCLRYRDFSQIIANILQILFYSTPIVWLHQQSTNSIFDTALSLNPINHLLNTFRGPILDDFNGISFFVSLSLVLIGWVLSIIVYRGWSRRAPYWL